MSTIDDNSNSVGVDATFAGPGEARALARAVDWSATPLGSVEQWPSTLRAAVRMCMASPTPLAIWAGPEFTLLYNDAYLPILGERARWAMGCRASAVGHEVWTSVRSEFEQVVQTGTSLRFEDRRYLVHRRNRVEEAYFTYTLSPIQDEDGRVLGILNICEEATSTMQALARSETLYRSLIRSMDVGFCIVEVLFVQERAIGLRILDANPAFAKHTGIRDPVGKSSRELVPNNEAYWLEVFERVALTGEPAWQELPAAELDRVFEIDAFRVGAPAERHVAVLLTDISDRKRAEEHHSCLLELADVLRPLRDSAEIERTAARVLCEHLSANRVGYWLVAGKGIAMDHDYTKGAPSIAGRHIVTSCQEEPVATLRRGDDLVIHDVDADPRLGASTREILHAMGVAAILATPLVRAGQWVGALTVHSTVPRVWTAREVSLLEEVAERTWASIERARAEQALRDSDQRKSEFLAVLSHELRNPLSAIHNSLLLLEDAPQQSELAVRARRILRRQSGHLTRLVDELLDVTRISRGKIELQRQRVDLREVVERTAEDFRTTFEERGIALRIESETRPAWVDGDSVRLAQILSNLLQNAVKFTPKDETVTMTLSTAEGLATISVRDTGEGIEPTQLERIFEPFEQLSQHMARTRGGLGLGLALVKGLVELHGGTVRASSPGVGRGAEFVITLPLVGPEHDGDSNSQPQLVPNFSRDILVIEDNIDAGDTLVELLKAAGYQARIAYDGRTGMALAREHPPAVVLCDVGLPDVSGYEVAKALRADPMFRGTLLVALTGYAQPEDRQRATEAGFDEHMAKPISLERLAELLHASTRLGSMPTEEQ